MYRDNLITEHIRFDSKAIKACQHYFNSNKSQM
jgi:hypothetical protein